MSADERGRHPNVLGTPLLFASLRAAEAAAQAEHDARSVLKALGGCGRGRCLRGVVAEIKDRVRSRLTAAAPTPGDDGIPRLLDWVNRLEAAMERRACLDLVTSIRRDRGRSTDSTWSPAQMPDLLQAGVASWLECVDDLGALHRDALEPGFRIACGRPEGDA